MRDYILVYINGKRYEIRGEQAFMSLSDYLRYERSLTGTKVVCAEGDCGACTVLRGVNHDRLSPQAPLYYESINSCITFMHLMDCTHLVTVEGLADNSSLNAVQTAMVEHHGAQCGFCTPGIVCAMTEFVNHQVCQRQEAPADRLDASQVRNALTGNLCRCTGYAPILNAGLDIDLNAFVTLQKRYETPEMLQDIAEHQDQGISITTQDRVFYAPTSFAEAADFKARTPESKIFSSATDMGVLINKERANPMHITNLSRVSAAHQIEESEGCIVLGARVTLSQLEHFCRSRIPEFARLMHIFASPQIKNKGTLVGNIANASPIADTLPFLFVTDAELELTSSAGQRRVNINHFYTGYKQLDLEDNEIISRVFIPIPESSDLLRLYKVSNRKDLDISTVTAAIRLALDEQQVIQKATLALGGVGPVVMRLPKTEAFLQGKSFSEAVFLEAGALAKSEITPISDVRASAAYRFEVAKNILAKFYYEFEELHPNFAMI